MGSVAGVPAPYPIQYPQGRRGSRVGNAVLVEAAGTENSGAERHVVGRRQRDWRVTFRFDGPDVTDVDYEDYH